jgi:two-component system, LytTR family, response regulator LytT
MKVLIIEDEPMAADILTKMLVEIYPSITIVGVVQTVRDAVQWLQLQTPDLIFMDINLGDENAFQIFQQIQLKTPVIFTTAYNEYAIQAFKVNSIDYLLKPIQASELAQSIHKFQEFQHKNTSVDFMGLIQTLQNQNNYQKRFMVTVGEKIVAVAVENVAYFFAQKRYVLLITQQKEQFVIDFTLDKLEELLNPQDFFRINRQFIIHFSAIKTMLNYSRSRVKIELQPSTKEDTIVSVERSHKFKEWLSR